MFTYVAIVVFAILGIIWSKSDWFNLTIKIGFFALAFWGLVEAGVVIQL